MSKQVIGAVAAVTLTLLAAFITLLFPFIDRDPLAEPFLEIDEAEGKVWPDSQVVIEIRGSFTEEEIRESLEIDPPVALGEEDLAVERIAKFPWHERFPWAKTRVAINPHKAWLFEPETSYTVSLKDEELTFETVTLPRVVDAYVDSVHRNDFNNVPTSSPIVLVFNEEVIWQDEYLDVDPPAAVATTTERSSTRGTELWVIPKERWGNSTTYTLTIKEGLRDIFGHEAIEEFSLDFTTWPLPSVARVAPFGYDLPVDSTVRIEFDRAVDRQAVEQRFRVDPPASGDFQWESDLVLNWRPSELQYSTTYTVSVGGRAIGGEPLVSTEWTFTTRSQPKVVEVQPVGESLPPDSPVKIKFEREVVRETVEKAFRIEPEVAGDFDWQDDRVLVWKPSKLEYSSAYTVSVGGESVDGDPIVPYEWTFTTEDPPLVVEIVGGDQSPTTLTAVARGGNGQYSYRWNTGETSEEIWTDLWYEEARTFEVTVTSGDLTATDSVTVQGAPSPCPPGWEIVSEEACYTEETLPGPVRTFVARVDLRDPDVQIGAAPAADVLGGVRTVSESARARDTIVSINGDFFGPRDSGYFTLGPIVSGGNFIYAPDHPGYGPDLPGVVLAIGPDHQSWVGQEQELKLSLRSEDGSTISLEHINSVPGGDELALFNAYWGQYLSLGISGCYAVFAPVVQEEVSANYFDCGPIQDIPLGRGEFVLVGRGDAAEWMKLHLGQPASFETSFPLEDIDFAVGGSHALIRDGVVVEELNPYLGGRHPRTAIGVDGEGFLYLVVVDGRSDLSRGMTLVELQRYLSGLGLVDAINLDGGGSSTMVLRESVMNAPSDGRERAVAAVVQVTEPRETCWHELVRC